MLPSTLKDSNPLAIYSEIGEEPLYEEPANCLYLDVSGEDQREEFDDVYMVEPSRLIENSHYEA